MLNNEKDFDILSEINIILIPKVPSPTNLANFRPISLCNVLYKLIAKVIANHLRKLLDSSINLTQSAFVLGRLIFDNVLLPTICFILLGRKKKVVKGIWP